MLPWLQIKVGMVCCILPWFHLCVVHCLQAQTLVTVSVHQDVVCSTVVASLLPTTEMSTLIELFNLSKLYSVKFMQK